MATSIEIHGQSTCPYAWRVRLAAEAKGIAYAWIAYDAAEPDARVAQNNPERASPKLVHGGFHLRETDVITAYLDEAFDGPALAPQSHQERAQMRLDMIRTQALYVSGSTVVDDTVRAAHAARMEDLEARLERRGDTDGPTLLDVNLIATVARLAGKELTIPAHLKRATAWWSNYRNSALYAATEP